MTTVVTNDNCQVYYGLASEITLLDKTKLYNGATYIAMDSSERYLFDAENNVWLLQQYNTPIGGIR